MLKKYPQIRKLMGSRNPWGFLLILLAVTSQTVIAASLSSGPWWLAVILAFLIGTVINHTCIALIHECSHNLLFKSKTMNLLSSILVNIHMVIPSAISFRKYHLRHHSQMGLYSIDADIPSRWEAELVKNVWYKKLLWLFLFPLFQSLRTMRVNTVKFFDGWVLANIILTLGFSYLIYHFFGGISLLYLASSIWFGFGLSSVGGRIIQEHFVFREDQETYSYYGLLNYPSLFVGLHVEHHDFPTIPWNHLPKLGKIAPEYYASFYRHTSWLKLVFRFIFDPKVSLYDRMIRDEKDQEIDANFQDVKTPKPEYNIKVA